MYNSKIVRIKMLDFNMQNHQDWEYNVLANGYNVLANGLNMPGFWGF